MTDEILFFDNDCISAFLWINNTSIITKLYGGKIAIPTQVYAELSACRGVAVVLKERIDKMLANNEAVCVDMLTDSNEYAIFSKLALDPPEGTKVIGRGEAACIALAAERNGVLASNNLSDVKRYIDEYKIKHTTTADILVEAYKKRVITFEEAETIWAEMLSKRRRIGADSFKQYLEYKTSK